MEINAMTEELRDKIDEMLSSDDYQYGMRSQNIDAILALLKAEYDRGREEGYSCAYDDYGNAAEFHS